MPNIASLVWWFASCNKQESMAYQLTFSFGGNYLEVELPAERLPNTSPETTVP